jgi:hypothetical protein
MARKREGGYQAFHKEPYPHCSFWHTKEAAELAEQGKFNEAHAYDVREISDVPV